MSREEVMHEQKRGEECVNIRKALEGEKVSPHVLKDAKQCDIIDGTLYHKDKRKKMP